MRHSSLVIPSGRVPPCDTGFALSCSSSRVSCRCSSTLKTSTFTFSPFVFCLITLFDITVLTIRCRRTAAPLGSREHQVLLWFRGFQSGVVAAVADLVIIEESFHFQVISRSSLSPLRRSASPASLPSLKPLASALSLLFALETVHSQSRHSVRIRVERFTATPGTQPVLQPGALIDQRSPLMSRELEFVGAEETGWHLTGSLDVIESDVKSIFGS